MLTIFHVHFVPFALVNFLTRFRYTSFCSFRRWKQITWMMATRIESMCIEKTSLTITWLKRCLTHPWRFFCLVGYIVPVLANTVSNQRITKMYLKYFLPPFLHLSFFHSLGPKIWEARWVTTIKHRRTILSSIQKKTLNYHLLVLIDIVLLDLSLSFLSTASSCYE